MHIAQNPILEYNLKVFPPDSSVPGYFAADNLDKGVLLISRVSLPDEKGRTAAGRSNAVSQQILGVLSEYPNIAYTRGVLVVQAATALVAADLDKGIVTSTMVGKAEAAGSSGAGWGRIVGGGNDEIIGNYYLVLV